MPIHLFSVCLMLKISDVEKGFFIRFLSLPSESLEQINDHFFVCKDNQFRSLFYYPCPLALRRFLEKCIHKYNFFSVRKLLRISPLLFCLPKPTSPTNARLPSILPLKFTKMNLYCVFSDCTATLDLHKTVTNCNFLFE